MTPIQEIRGHPAIPGRLSIRKNHKEEDSIQLPSNAWHEAESQVRRIRLARQQGWHSAASRQQRALLSVLRRLRSELSAIEQQLESASNIGDVPPMREVLADFWTLQGLKEHVS